MYKSHPLISLLIVCFIVVCPSYLAADDCKRPHGFSINAAGDQVWFAPGNLQYQASTNTWRFAERQFDRCGDGIAGNTTVYYTDRDGNRKLCNNQDASATYEGWIDIFGWGTSGYNGSNPWMTHDEDADYGPSAGGFDVNSGDNRNYDWGYYNDIYEGTKKHPKGTWRTPTDAEWSYVFYTRKVNGKEGLSIVNLKYDPSEEAMFGYILYPDDFSFTKAGVTPIAVGRDYRTEISLSDWEALEKAGCVFLPVTCHRSGGWYPITAVNHIWHDPWSSTNTWWGASCGLPVRLIMGIPMRTDTIVCGETYMWDLGYKTIPITAPGDYSDTLRGLGGYDSIISFLHLIIPLVIERDTTVVILQGETFTWDLGYKTLDFDKNGEYYDTLKNACGWDSITSSLHLFVYDLCKKNTFTVNKNGDKVIFSPGNLQYCAAQNKWRFAERQFDRCGDGTIDGTKEQKDNAFTTVFWDSSGYIVPCNNLRASETYGGWIDFFGWGTSGVDGANPPYYNSTNEEDYSWSDWGKNTIGTDPPNTWRTLTKEEWQYLGGSRGRNYSMVLLKYGATLKERLMGAIFYPDDFPLEKLPTGNTSQAAYWNYATDIDLTDWLVLEKAGCVFLPCGKMPNPYGYMKESDSDGYYWAGESKDGETYAAELQLDINDQFVTTTSASNRYFVRLVRDAEGAGSTGETKVGSEIIDTLRCGNTYIWDLGYKLREITQTEEEKEYTDTLRVDCGEFVSKLKLVLKPLVAKTDEKTETICAGDKYTWNLGYETREVERENDYFDTLRSVQGCDSVISILHLTVKRPIDDDYSGVIHCGETYEWDYGYGKENITVPGIHTRQKMDDETGCVSIVSTLHLMFSADDVEMSEKDETICNEQTYTWHLSDGRTREFDTEGDYYDTIWNGSCMKTISHLHLVVLPSNSTHDSTTYTLRYGNDYTWHLEDGRTIPITQTESEKEYYDTVVVGCDSVISYLKLLNQPQPTDINPSNATAQYGEIYSWDMDYQTLQIDVEVDSTYYDTLRNVDGCDSIISILHLIVEHPELPVDICGPPTFSINPDGGKVIMAPGNLQYRASTNTWRFAERQFDRCGDGTEGKTTVFWDSLGYTVPCNNVLASETYGGWIGVFAWGTSGHGQKAGDKYARNFAPYCNSIEQVSGVAGYYNPYGYGPSFDPTYGDKNVWGPEALSNDIDTNSGANRYFDWGYANKIKEKHITHKPATWRTLTASEWIYMMSTRTVDGYKNAFSPVRIKYGPKSTDTVTGLLVYPDNFYWIKVDVEPIPFVSQQGGKIITEIDLNTWEKLESAGALFLPNEEEILKEPEEEFTKDKCRVAFWSSSSYVNANNEGLSFLAARDLSFELYDTYRFSTASSRCFRQSVRLARDYTGGVEPKINEKTDTIQCGDIYMWDMEYKTLPITQGEHEKYYYDILPNIQGCDSIISILHLFLKVTQHETIDTIYCTDTYSWDLGYNTIEITQTEPQNDYFDTLRNSIGCDSVISHLHLTRFTTQYESKNITVCIGNKYEWYTDNNIEPHLTILVLEDGYYQHNIPFSTEKECDSLCYNLTITANICENCMPLTNLQLMPPQDVCADDTIFNYSFRYSKGFPASFSVRFDSKAIQDGFINSDGTFENENRFDTLAILPLKVPQIEPYLRPFDYHVDLEIIDICGNSYRFIDTLYVFYPSWIIDQHWNDVLALFNSRYNGGYDFSAYQWYENNEPIYGATRDHYYFPANLSEKSDYRALLTRSDDGYTTFTCPVTVTSRVDASVLNEPYIYVHPTFVPKEEPTIQIVSNLEGNFWIYDMAGKMVSLGDFRSYDMKKGATLVRLPSIQSAYLVYLIPKDKKHIKEKSYIVIVR